MLSELKHLYIKKPVEPMFSSDIIPVCFYFPKKKKQIRYTQHLHWMTHKYRYSRPATFLFRQMAVRIHANKKTMAFIFYIWRRIMK